MEHEGSFTDYVNDRQTGWVLAKFHRAISGKCFELKDAGAPYWLCLLSISIGTIGAQRPLRKMARAVCRAVYRRGVGGC